MNKETLSRNEDSERSVFNGEKRVLKLVLDAYYRQVTVATQEDGGRIKASGKMGYGFDNWMQKKLDEGWEIYSCYEAVATGYWLHRQMDGGHRLHRMGLADVLGARLDDRPKFLTFLPRSAVDRARDIFHRHGRIDAVLIEQIDMVRQQPF